MYLWITGAISTRILRRYRTLVSAATLRLHLQIRVSLRSVTLVIQACMSIIFRVDLGSLQEYQVLKLLRPIRRSSTFITPNTLSIIIRLWRRRRLIILEMPQSTKFMGRAQVFQTCLCLKRFLLGIWTKAKFCRLSGPSRWRSWIPSQTTQDHAKKTVFKTRVMLQAPRIKALPDWHSVPSTLCQSSNSSSWTVILRGTTSPTIRRIGSWWRLRALSSTLKREML